MPPVSLQFPHPHPKDFPQPRLHVTPASLTPLSRPFHGFFRTSVPDSVSPLRDAVTPSSAPLTAIARLRRFSPFHQSARIHSQSPAHPAKATLIPSCQPWAEHRARQLPLADWPLAPLTSANRVEKGRDVPLPLGSAPTSWGPIATFRAPPALVSPPMREKVTIAAA